MPPSVSIANVRISSLALLTLFAASACSDYDSTEPARPMLTTLVVTLGTPVIVVGDTTTATAAGLDQYGKAITTGTVAWSSSAPAVAAVNPTTGVILGIARGTAQIAGITEGEQTASQVITIVSPMAVAVGGGSAKGRPRAR